MNEGVPPKEFKLQIEDNLENDGHSTENVENSTKPEQNVEEGKRRDEVCVNIIDEGNNEASKWRSGRREGFKAFVYVMGRPQTDNETRKSRSDADMGGGRSDAGERSMFRNDFVAMVFLRVAVMFAMTFAITASFMFTDLRRLFSDPLEGLIIFILITIMLVGIQCCMVGSECARRGPCSYFMLLITVVGWSIICAYICLHYKLTVVFYAIIATCICVIICYLLALSSFDFTSWLLYVVVIGVALAVVSMIVLFITIFTGKPMTLLHMIILFASTILTLVMLVIELQMILGGRSVELDEEDFNLGAFLLYTSIVSLFLRLLQIIGFLDND